MVDQSNVEPERLTELTNRLEKGEFDLVAVGRALLQNPDWVIKVREGRLNELENYTKASLRTLI